MAAPALDAAPVVDVEPRVPGGGGPGYEGPDGRGGGGGDPDDFKKRRSLYRLGVVLTLAAITVLFISLALVFWFRSQSVFLWQQVEAPRALWISTAILGASSWMLELSREALEKQHWFAYRRRLLLTIYLGLAFMACQGAALWQLMREGMYLNGNPHASAFYIFTGAHGLHLACGMLALAYLLLRRERNWNHHRLAAESTAIYWHFMGVLWIALFAILLFEFR